MDKEDGSRRAPMKSVAMNILSKKHEEDDGTVVVQDNPIAIRDHTNSAGTDEKKHVTIAPSALDDSDATSSMVSKIAARESALCAQLGIPYDEGNSVLCKAVANMQSSTGPLMESLEGLHKELSWVLGISETKKVDESEELVVPKRSVAMTLAWKNIGDTVIAANRENKIMDSLTRARRWEPKEGTVGHKVFKVVRHPKFQHVMTANIILTGVIHGMVATSWAREDSVFENGLYVMDIILVIVSTVEFLAVSFTFSWRALLDGWNCLDFTTLTISWLVIFVGNPYWAFGVTRTFRLTRQFESSKLLVEGFMMALPSILWVLLIIFINICVFTVIGVQFFREKSPEQYGNIRKGLYTSFKLMTLENWTDEAETLRQAYKFGSVYFILFITTNSFILLNLLIATVVDLIREIGDRKELKRMEKQRKATLTSKPISTKITNPFFNSLPKHPTKDNGKADRINENNVKDFQSQDSRNSFGSSVMAALTRAKSQRSSSMALL